MSYAWLGSTKNGAPVVYEDTLSHAATHFADTPGLQELAREVIAQTTITSEYMWFETDLKRIVGTSDLVTVDATDTIVYAKRRNRDTYARFTTTRQPQPSSLVTVALLHRSDGQYELTSAWIGPVGVPFPDEPNATSASRRYWATHALVWGTQQTIPGTERTDVPW